MNKTGLVYRVTALIASIAVYLPVLGGILFVMWYIIPLWYFSWNIVEFIFPFYYWDGHWNPSTINWGVATSVWAVDFLILILGIGLLLYGLKTMVTHKSKKDELITSGPYRWVRHPQHLGIILFLLAPIFVTYVRPNDILSWSLIAFGLIVSADIEEVSLSKRFGESYVEYRAKVPFIFPYSLSLPTVMRTGALDQGKPTRYVLWFVIYWIIMSFILFLFSFVRIDYWM
ncbi:MAG: methyltransferase [Candidatus Thorarchaeota archaeon]